MGIKPFTHTLALLQGGGFNHEVAEAFSRVIKGVEETGKAGKLTITLDVKKAGGAIAITSKVTDKAPEEAAVSDLFWATVEGNVSVQNPNQQRLDLQEVPAPKPDLRDAG